MGKDGQRACGVKSEPTDGVGIDIVLIEDALDRGTDAAPDIIRGLFLCLG